MTRILIVNADDFGRSSGINRGIVRAHDEGIVTSTSAMVRRPAAGEAAALADERPRLGIGLHVDLSDWGQRSGDGNVVYRISPDDAESIRAEVDAQLDRFRALFGRQPTHVDSHHHLHVEEPVRSILVALGRALGVPVRDCTSGIVYREEFYGRGAITRDAIVRLIDSLPPGIAEVGCHPAAEPEPGSAYSEERPLELAVLCDPEVRAALDARGIALRSFAGLAGA